MLSHSRYSLGYFGVPSLLPVARTRRYAPLSLRFLIHVVSLALTLFVHFSSQLCPHQTFTHSLFSLSSCFLPLGTFVPLAPLLVGPFSLPLEPREQPGVRERRVPDVRRSSCTRRDREPLENPTIILRYYFYPSRTFPLETLIFSEKKFFAKPGYGSFLFLYRRFRDIYFRMLIYRANYSLGNSRHV